MMPSLASHAKVYGDFFKWSASAYGAWANNVCTGAYPEDKHSFNMEERELDKFLNAIEKF
jgi:3-methyl-2-oxobutanoate hydroxymethyltransferase